MHSEMVPPGRSSRFPWWVTLLDVLGLVLLALAAIVIVGGGIRFRVLGVRISVTSALRLILPAILFIGVRHATFRGMPLWLRVPDAAQRWRARWLTSEARRRAAFVAALAAFLLLLVSHTVPTRTGDGHEYMAMARNFARLRPPSLSVQEIVGLQRPFWLENPSYPRVFATTVEGKDGRRDFYHFWLYSLLASPLVGIASIVGVHPVYGFLALNLLCFGAAAILLLPRIGARATLLLTTGPLIWWIDKAQTEIFTFSALAVAIALVASAPGAALVVMGAAVAQNPALAPVACIFFAYAAARGAARSGQFWVGAVAGGAIAALHPLYYWMRLGVMSPLTAVVYREWPGPAEVTAFLWDPNLGLFTNHPALALAAAGAVLTLLVRAPKRLLAGDLWFTVVVGAALLVAFCQTKNFNHGGTPSVSRYALWLIPLFVPLFAALRRQTGASSSTWLSVAAVLAVAWGAVVYPPVADEYAYVKPTPLARWLWTTMPAMDNPLPEVFCERVQGTDPDVHTLPASTEGCEKILFAGEGKREVAWPPCPIVPVPPECRVQDVLCYANRADGRYTFARAPRQPAFEWTTPGVLRSAFSAGHR
jgi:hypothetical protein